MRFILCIMLWLVFALSLLKAQCSDAGVCSIAHVPATPEKGGYTTHIGISYLFGASAKEDSLSFHTMRLEIDYNLFSNVRLSLKLPYSFQKGPQGSVSGIGDAIVIGDYTFYTTEDFHLRLSVGVRLHLGSDHTNNLPQIYQSSLGTTDVLAGISAGWQNVSFTAGYQRAGGRNSNITELQRADDVLLKAGYFFSSGAWSLEPEILAIIRTGESSVLNPLPLTRMYISVPGSKQTQVNAGVGAVYHLSEQWKIKTFAALSLLQRKVNVDGLTRALTLSVGIEMGI